jgi:serine protease inhibitor
MKQKNSLLPFTSMLLISIVFTVIFIHCSDNINAPVEKRDISFSKIEQSIVSSSSQFGFALFKEINNSKMGGNIFISPLSVSVAFGMALNGANSSTYDEIKSVLGLNELTQDEVNKTYKSVIEALSNVDKQVQFQSANSIWYRSGFYVEQNFIDVNKNYFNALVQSADFNNAATVNMINNWVKQNTNSKIEKIIDQIKPEIVMYLINAIYFKGTWKYQFDKTKTADFPFRIPGTNGVSRKMMMQETDLEYYNSSNYAAIDIPYGNESYRMRIILPSEGVDAGSVLQNLNPDEFNRINSSMKKQRCVLRMPLFKLEYDIELNEILSKMGMKRAFISGQADFSGITKDGQLCISEVKHKTFVDVNEEGTEAAAVTSIGFERTSMGGDGKIYFNVDRPFLFMIYENNSNTILFMGSISNPTID